MTLRRLVLSGMPGKRVLLSVVEGADVAVVEPVFIGFEHDAALQGGGDILDGEAHRLGAGREAAIGDGLALPAETSGTEDLRGSTVIEFGHAPDMGAAPQLRGAEHPDYSQVRKASALEARYGRAEAG